MRDWVRTAEPTFIFIAERPLPVVLFSAACQKLTASKALMHNDALSVCELGYIRRSSPYSQV